MATNVPDGSWSVKIGPISETITYTQIIQKLGVTRSRISFHNDKSNDTRYALINNFSNEDEARKFVNQWSGTSILGETIECIAFTPTVNENKTFLSSRKSLFDIKTEKPIKRSTMIDSEIGNNNNTTKVEYSPLSYQKPSQDFSQTQKQNSPIERKPVKADVEDKRPLCQYANKGACRNKSKECQYRHQRCNNYEFCPDLKCLLAHAKKETTKSTNVKPRKCFSGIECFKADCNFDHPEGWNACVDGIKCERYECNANHPPQRKGPCQHKDDCKSHKCKFLHPNTPPFERKDFGPTTNKPYHNRPRSDSCSSGSSIQSTSRKRRQCRNSIKCFKADCEFDHPDGWYPCIDGMDCENYDCTANHPYKRKEKCRDGEQCKSSDCRYLHPNTRAEECPLRAKCKKWNCSKLHPRSRARPCSNKEKCTDLSCLCLHPPKRNELLCSSGADCRDLTCKLNHPPERPPICDQPDTCSNFNCTRLHGLDWNPCEAGDECKDEQCRKIHSPERNIKAATTTSGIKKKYQKESKKSLKTPEQRMKDRDTAQLPILSRRTEFCQRLKDDRVLIVTAETGSGKSTQLPQYAAEYFGSLVVCTQPRVVAALSLSRRVAEEYDGQSVGESVGYQVGSGNRVPGTHIMFMTDAALIRESQRDSSLKDVRVLIIDEAHERALNTDIVLGIAKLLLTQRPDDFYVVIASATIDPARFLKFFNRPTNAPLKVEGRVFPVTCANKAPSSDCSDRQLIDKHIVPSVIELYPQHEGHTLVFLPGQGEIDRALRIFKSKLPDDCICFPLYGSQSPEDQEKVIKFNENDKRMVVFCTNVAETSLTIPNVRLVIDSGLAKEARYDVKRRVTVIETVRISRSSADQRKGRAGRTAEGYCVRLYKDAELKRPNIEPEILRSSLDLVLLQLIRLNLDPNTFPFMDPPTNDVIRNSIDLLTNLKCIESPKKITKKGELSTDLGLDPRLSTFIIDIYIRSESLLTLAAGIVAILSAPGTVFFMGGASKEAKEDAKERVARDANDYKSDLLHLYSVYDRWKNAGTKQTQGKCSLCTKPIRYCNCRAKYSNENGLNNKILQNIDNSCTTIIKQIKSAQWLKPGNEMPQDLANIIGIHLAQLFPEQCGYLLVPQLPIEGVRLVSTDIRANITNTSVFMQKLHIDSYGQHYQHFVAMTIIQLPSGSYIIERLHPIPRTVATIQSSMQKLMTIENIGSEPAYYMRQKLNTYQSEPWAKWVVYQYDRPQCCFIVWGTEDTRSKIVPIVQRIKDETLKKVTDVYDLLECGPIKANFQSGLVCTHINKTTNALRLDLQNVPNKPINDLKDWLKKMFGIDWNEIKQYDFYTPKVKTEKTDNNDNQRKYFYLVFKNEDAFQRARNKVPSYYMSEQGNDVGSRRDEEKESWGRELVIQTPSNVTDAEIITRYGANVVTKCVQINRKDDKPRVESSLKLNNLPLTTDEPFLRNCLQTDGGPNPKRIHVGRAKNDASGWARVTFNDGEQRNKAAVIYNLRLCQQSFFITIQGKKGPVQKSVQTAVVMDDDVNTGQNSARSAPKNLFRITLISRDIASHIYTSQTTNIAIDSDSFAASQWTVDGSATVTVLRTDLYPDCQLIVDRVCEKFAVKATSKDISNFGKRYTFGHGSPQKTSLAALMLSQHFTPMNIKLNTDRQRQLFNELEEVGVIQKWAVDLRLDIKKNKYNTSLEIRGPQIAQGQLMRRIADYSDNFNQRFREHQLSSTIAGFFGRQKAASVKLQQINSKWSSKLCSVSFIPKISTIMIFGKPRVSLKDVDHCEKEVVQLLDEIVVNPNDEENEEDEDEDDEDNNIEENDVTDIRELRQERRCVFCKQKS